MILREPFNPKKPYKYLRYLRMSSHVQNERSPEQQADTIELVKSQAGYPWDLLRDYRDDGLSGKLVRKRPSFRQMLQDIKMGRVNPDLILVDTFERFGRNDELESLRRLLASHYGVLLLTADSRFADPTTFTGKILCTIESGRAVEDNRIKAHNVARGRRDAVQLGHWPGGPVPSGYKLEQVFTDKRGLKELDYSILVPDLAKAWIIQLVFKLAFEQGWGSSLIAQHLHSCPEIPERFQRVSSQTVNRWLSNSIYIGVFCYNKLNVQVIEDVRKQRRNSDDDLLIKENFCEPLVAREVFEEVQRQRKPRSERGKKAKASGVKEDTKLLQVVRPGTSIKYPLSGLVICGHCGRSMVARSTGAYLTKARESKRYTAYICPGRYDKICANHCSVKEDWLRTTVVDLLRARLFPSSSNHEPLSVDGMKALSWFAELRDAVRQACEQLANEQSDQAPVLQARITDLEARQRGRVMSLSNPDLDATLRGALEAEFATTTKEIKELKNKLQSLRQTQERSLALCDDQAIVARLNKLNEIFGTASSTRAGLELSLHIEAIRCDKDGKVVIRTCKLGAMADARELFQGHECLKVNLSSSASPDMIRARRRTIRQAEPDEDEDEMELYDIAFDAADPNRFKYLPEQWFWEDTFQIPEPTFWAKENAEIVATKKRDTEWTIAKLADYFGKSEPTIRHALKIYREQGDEEMRVAS